MQPRVAILGPFETESLRSFLRPSEALSAMPPGMGGSCLVNLVQARLERGMPTDVITLDPRATRDITRYEGDRVRLWVVRRRPRKALRDGYREETTLLVRALTESRPDVCHANWTYEYGLAALKQDLAPAVTTVHDHAGHMLRHLGWRYLPHYLIARRVIRKSTRLTAVSPYIADYVRRVGGREAAVIPNLLSRMVWDRAQEATPVADTIVSALTWAPFRNATTALRAFAAVRKQRTAARYLMIGPGFEADGPAAHWARSQGLDEGVQFLGRVPYRDALALMASATVLLHPSLEDSFGGPVAEAMALGVPVIAAREAAGPAWLLADGCGELVSGHSSREITEALLKTLGQTSSLLTGKARERIRACCDPDTVLASWSKQYLDLMKDSP